MLKILQDSSSSVDNASSASSLIDRTVNTKNNTASAINSNTIDSNPTPPKDTSQIPKGEGVILKLKVKGTAEGEFPTTKFTPT